MPIGDLQSVKDIGWIVYYNYPSYIFYHIFNFQYYYLVENIFLIIVKMSAI